MTLPKTANAKMIGKSAVLTAEYETPEGEILAEGTVVEIEDFDRSGVTIKTTLCPACGRSVKASGISKEDLTLTQSRKPRQRQAASLEWKPYPQQKPTGGRKQCLLRVRTAAGAGLEYELKKFNVRAGRFHLNPAEDSRVVAWTELD